MHYLQKELNDLVRCDSAIFEFLQEGSLDGLWYWDMTKPDNEWMSPRFKEVFGYKDHEIPNTSAWWQNHIFQEDLPGVLQRVQAHIEDPNTPYDQIVRYKHRDGSTIWIRCRGIAIFNEEGTPIRMLGCHTDITPLKTVEFQLQERNQELERAHQELSEFVDATSHDLRSPLRAIHSYTELVQELEAENLSPLGKEYLARVIDTTQHLQSLLTAMLDVSRQGHATIHRKDFDPTALLRRVEDRLRDQLVESGGRIALENLPATMHADPTHLERILQNLINNAIKYAHPDTPPVIKVRMQPGSRQGWHIEVQDNGIGIADKYQERVFKMFERLHSKHAIKGHGLGLPLVRKLARLHGGDAWVESTPEQGSTFHVSLDHPNT